MNFRQQGRLLKNTAGQVVMVQYVLLFFVVVAAVITMSFYFRRAVQARIRDAVIFSGNAVKVVHDDPAMNIQGEYTLQYEPYYTKAQSLRNAALEERRHLGEGLLFELSPADSVQTQTLSEQAPPKDAK